MSTHDDNLDDEPSLLGKIAAAFLAAVMAAVVIDGLLIITLQATVWLHSTH